MSRSAASRAISPKSMQTLEARAGEAAQLLKLLANDHRLIILCRLSDAGNVGFRAWRIRQSQPVGAVAASRQSCAPRDLVATRRDAQTIYYRLASPNALKLVNALCDLYGGKPGK